jgi:hypothetical protein
LSGFVVALLAAHLTSGLDPVDHVVSEYASGPGGWAFACGLVAWGVSLAATGLLMSRAIVRRPLFTAAAALVLAAVCPTQAVAGRVPAGDRRTITGILHDVGSGIGTTALVVAIVATLATRRPHTAVTVGFAGAWVVYAVLLVAGDPAPGLRQRVIIATALGWQALTLRAAR